MQIILAHTKADKAIVEEKIKTPLINAGYNVQLSDTDDKVTLGQLINNCDLIIEALTPAFFDSEIDTSLSEIARNLSKSIISVQLLETDYPLATRNLNIIDFISSDDSAFQNLINSIEVIKDDTEHQTDLKTPEFGLNHQDFLDINRTEYNLDWYCNPN